MRNCLILFICFLLSGLPAYTQQPLPVWDPALSIVPEKDWLVDASGFKAGVYSSENNREIILWNGLVRRTFRLSEKGLACVDFYNPITGQQLLRAVRPEARITVAGKVVHIGGLIGQPEQAYLRREWIEQLKADPEALPFLNYSVAPIRPVIDHQPVPAGVSLQLRFGNSTMEATIHYELYDGIPLMVKWLELKNLSTTSLRVDRVVNEILAFTEEESAVVGSPEQMKKQHGIYVETNYAFNNAMRYDISDQTTHWLTDSTYTSQVNYNFQTPCVLEVFPEKAPGIDLRPGESFRSVRTHELLQDSYDRERRGLAIRRMYRTVAPWTTRNPIFMHLVSKNDEEVRTAIDQCVATGYEAVILSFGSHLEMEDQSEANLRRWKEFADYAHSKNILLGGYSLFSSRRISDEDDVVDAKTGKPGGAFFGNAPCFGSKWGLAYRDKIMNFFRQTGFDIWENDGPYPGDVCASTAHPGHRDLADSQWRQMEIQKGLYRWLNEQGVYINAPDWYFLDGTHKIGIGYREVNFSLPRDRQRILNRQNIHDGTIEKTGPMSWGFVPLTRYHGGGPESVLEPLKDHLADYEQLMMQYYGAGVQACYRGPRLYDSEETRQLVSRVIDWYKRYRKILNSDMIHLRRADGRDWDGWMHVNPALKEKALVMLFNPTAEIIVREIRLPLHYTGLKSTVSVREKEGKAKSYNISGSGELKLKVSMPADGYTWLVLE